MGRPSHSYSSMSDGPATDEHRLDEYRDLSENMRFYGNMRFAQLTLFFVATGALLNAVASHNFRWPLQPLVGLGGLIIVVAFAVLEHASVRYWLHHRMRAVEIEEALDFWQYRNRPHKSVFNGTNAVRLLFYATAAMWLAYGITAVLAERA